MYLQRTYFILAPIISGFKTKHLTVLNTKAHERLRRSNNNRIFISFTTCLFNIFLCFYLIEGKKPLDDF